MVYKYTNLKALNGYLSSNAFVNGFKLTADDIELMRKIEGEKIEDDMVHVKRWLKHLQSYTLKELKEIENPCGCACKCAGKAPAKKDEEEVDDLFGSSDSESEETKKAKEETRKKIEAAKASGGKLKKVARSMIVLEIKPWEDTTDMTEILNSLPDRVQMEGLTWGKGEVKDGNFGIKYVAMPAVIIDDLCSTEELVDLIIETYGDDVIQNADIVSFNKME